MHNPWVVQMEVFRWQWWALQIDADLFLEGWQTHVHRKNLMAWGASLYNNEGSYNIYNGRLNNVRV